MDITNEEDAHHHKSKMFRNLKLASLCSPAAFGVKCLQQGQSSATTTAATPTSTQPATTQLIQPVVAAQGAAAPSSPSPYSSSVPRSAVSANSVFQKHVSSSSTSLGGGHSHKEKQFSSVLRQQPFQQSRHVSTKGPSNTTHSDVLPGEKTARSGPSEVMRVLCVGESNHTDKACIERVQSILQQDSENKTLRGLSL